MNYSSPFIASFKSLSFKISSGIRFATLLGAGRALPSPFFAAGPDEDPTNRFLGLVAVVAGSTVVGGLMAEGPPAAVDVDAAVESVMMYVCARMMWRSTAMAMATRSTFNYLENLKHTFFARSIMAGGSKIKHLASYLIACIHASPRS